MNKKATANDHDLLIGLDTKFDIFSVQMSKDIAEVKDGVNTRISSLEQKTIGYDKLINEIDPLKLAQMAYAHEKFINDFNITKKLVLAIIGFMGAVLGTVLTLAIQSLRLFKGL